MQVDIECVLIRFRECIGSHVTGCCYHDWSHNSAVLQVELNTNTKVSLINIAKKEADTNACSEIM